MSTSTRPITQHPTAEVRERGLAVINAVMPQYATGMHKASLRELKAEAYRLEALPTSRVTKMMRSIVGEELASRGGAR